MSFYSNKKDENLLLLEVEIEKIILNPRQPRKFFSDEELEELAKSIREVGILQPPLVRPLNSTQQFELISGERRLRAMQKIGWKKIPVLIRKTEDSASAKSALIENIQRSELNSLEIAWAMNGLMKEFGLTQEQLSEQIGKKRSTIANYVRLLALDPEMQKSLQEEKITMGHAKILLSLEDKKSQKDLHQMILKYSLSVRDTERKAQGILQERKKRIPANSKSGEEIAKRLEEKLGTRVQLVEHKEGGKIVIEYMNYDDIDRILDLFQISL